MARLLVLDNPDHAEGNRARGHVVAAYPDGTPLGLMEGAEFLVIDCPELTAGDVAEYLADGVPASVRAAEAAEQSRFRADVQAQMTAHAAELAAGTMTQADVLALVTPFDTTKVVNPRAHPWRAKRIALATLAGAVAGLGARRTYLATTATSRRAMIAAQEARRATRRTEFLTRLRTALAAAPLDPTEDAANDPEDESHSEETEAADVIARLLDERKRRRLLRTRHVTPITVTRAQLIAATV